MGYGNQKTSVASQLFLLKKDCAQQEKRLQHCMAVVRNFELAKSNFVIQPNLSHPPTDRLQNTCVGITKLQANFDVIISGI